MSRSGGVMVRGFALAWRWGRHLPGPVVRAATTLAADITWLRHGTGVRRLESNLRRVRPDLAPAELRRLCRAGMRSYLRYYGEAFTLPGFSPQQIAARVRVVGRENVQQHLDAGRQVVMALGHLGNWDLAGAWATADLAPVTTVAERLEPEELFQEYVGFREGLGMRILPHTGGSDVFRALVRASRTGPGVIPLLADRDLTARGVEVQLFGETARVAAGPAALTVMTGAPLCPVGISYERLRGERRRRAGTPWGVVVEFFPALEIPEELPHRDRVQAVSQAWVDRVADVIAAHPQDWHMLQRVFVADLDPGRYAATVATATGQP
ncbi:phosphatidylinositol mannoside acyltransferase [Cellulomonas sp. NTE-D12]|uniref:phosphatidylinositol mannoside acyltransferase n=1 Tax=Cellulomonas sp. NTE-D12 TaxID=2962632 RepID=UPI00308B8DCB|nr:lipid A biosynthesis lauroyl acyltransferase [Cellulomonas sp. NTE-D12]